MKNRYLSLLLATSLLLPLAAQAATSLEQMRAESEERVRQLEQQIIDLEEEHERNLQRIEDEAVVKMLQVIVDSQATIDRLSPLAEEVGSSSCQALNDRDVTRECESMCQTKWEGICNDACENVKKDNADYSALNCTDYVPICMEEQATDGLRECENECRQECGRGDDCVCVSGKVDKTKTRELDEAERSLKSAYDLLQDKSKDVQKELSDALRSRGITIVKNGDKYVVEDIAIEATTTSGTFSDITPSHAYSSAIEWAKGNRILQGYPDGTFKPDRTVNRAEFLKIVLEAKGGNTNTSSSTSGFSDVDENAWYAPYVRYAKEQGIVQGYPDGTFKPEQAVNFAEALKMAYNALGVTTTELDGEWYERFLRHAQLNNVLFDASPNVGEGMSRKDVVWIVWKVMTHAGTWQQPEVSRNVRQSSSSSTRSTATTNTAPTTRTTSTLNEDTEAVIKAHCSEDWGSDYEMRAYCEKNQRDAVETLNLDKPNDITDEQFGVIRAGCKEDWPTDYEMRAYCEKNQFGGVRDVGESRPSGIGESEYQIIKAECLEDWPNDFEMQAYCEENQYDAVRTLNATNTSASVRSHCASEWPRDYEMRVYCEKQ